MRHLVRGFHGAFSFNSFFPDNVSQPLGSYAGVFPVNGFPPSLRPVATNQISRVVFPPFDRPTRPPVSPKEFLPFSTPFAPTAEALLGRVTLLLNFLPPPPVLALLCPFNSPSPPIRQRGIAVGRRSFLSFEDSPLFILFRNIFPHRPE